MKSNVSKNFFLISFLPAIAYWYLESNYSLQIALCGGMILACLELIIEKIFVGHLHSLSKFNFFLILFLGIVSFIGEEGIWFKLQPCMTGLGIGLYILFRIWKGSGLLFEMMESLGGNKLPKLIMTKFEKHLSLFFISYGIFMGGIALFSSTNYWLFFKTAGFYMISFLFLMVELFYLRKQMVIIYKKQRIF